jgi:hypothetical protein
MLSVVMLSVVKLSVVNEPCMLSVVASPGTNDLAYFERAKKTWKKSFITLIPGCWWSVRSISGRVHFLLKAKTNFETFFIFEFSKKKLVFLNEKLEAGC